jgi:hypothetical protein
MAARTTRTRPGKRAKSGIGQAIHDHPVGTAAVAAGAVVGALLLRKAANTAARVVTIKAAAGAATEVAKSVRGGRKAR